MSNWLQRLLESPVISRTRRNHALEHAIIHLVGRSHPGLAVFARSTPRGLVVYGDLPTEELVKVVTEALERLRKGQRQLAVHPNCGTSLVTAGTLSGLAALATMGLQRVGSRKRGILPFLGALPLAILASTVALIFSQPLGQRLQSELTVDPDIGSLHIVSIIRRNQGKLVFHTIRTAD